jgi:metallophosphoesterase superfamily enzyme
MFHSIANKELDWFIKWRNDFPELDIQLIMGNHDILKKQWYKEAGVTINYEKLAINHFSFVHDITDLTNSKSPISNYVFSGHIHPGIRINGAGKQSLHFPCFYFTPGFCVLPAFSRFTGLAMVRPKEEDHVFAIVNQTIIQL